MAQRKGHNQEALVGACHMTGRIKHSPPADVVRQRAIYEALADLGEVIYAITCPDGLIKIGHTACLRDRRRHHGAAFEDIVAVVPGSYEDEQLIHESLRDHVARGREYYRPDPPVLEFVNEIRSRAGVPPLPPSC